MARLSQQALTDAAQAIQQAGGGAVTDMEMLEETLQSVRLRVRSAEHHGPTEAQPQGMIRAVRPTWHYVFGLPELAHVGGETKSDLCWNLYAASVSRTANADAFPDVTGSVEMWQNVMDIVTRDDLLRPRLAPIQPVARSSFVRALQIAVLGLVMLAAESWFPSGRMRFYCVLSGVSFLRLPS